MLPYCVMIQGNIEADLSTLHRFWIQVQRPEAR
jgi:hypothetical protein